jgi:hypothetical protein
MLFNRAIGADEAGFYIGDSPDADARLVGNVAAGNRFGILWRNAEGGAMVGNVVRRNCTGIMVLSGIPGLPGLAGDVQVTFNLVRRNNLVCEEGDEGPGLSGVGVMLAGAHDSRVVHNLITRNRPSGPTAFSGGVVVVTDFLGTAPKDNLVARNILRRNKPDLFWDGTGSGNLFRHNICTSSDPAGLCPD